MVTKQPEQMNELTAATATAKPAKKYSPMSYNKPLVRRRIAGTAARFKHSRIPEIETALNQSLASMYSDGLLPFKSSDLREMKFVVSFDDGGMVVHLPDRLKWWLNEGGDR